MGIVVPDIVCLREPNILIPWKVPVGLVRVNKEHSVADGIQVCLTARDAWPPIDLITGKECVNDTTHGRRTSKAFSSSTGLAHGYINETIPQGGGKHVYFPLDKPLADDGFSLMLLYVPYCDSNIFVQDTGLYSSVEGVHKVGYSGISIPGYGKVLKLSGTTANTLTVSSENFDGINLYATIWSFRSRTDYEIQCRCINNPDNNIGALFTTDNSFVSAPLDRLGSQIWDEDTYHLWELGVVWDRGLSKKEIDGLFDDPYQFLIPA